MGNFIVAHLVMAAPHVHENLPDASAWFSEDWYVEKKSEKPVVSESGGNHINFSPICCNTNIRRNTNCSDNLHVFLFLWFYVSTSFMSRFLRHEISA